MEQINYQSSSFWGAVATMFIAVISAIFYMYYYKKCRKEQQFDRYWYYYPANEVLASFAFVQFVVMTTLYAAPDDVLFLLLMFVEAMFIPSYLLHFCLCYQKQNPFIPDELCEKITPVNSYKLWKVAILYAVPGLLLVPAYAGRIPYIYFIGLYDVPLNLAALWWVILVVRPIEEYRMWRLPFQKSSTYLLRSTECFNVYISIDQLNYCYRVSMGEPKFSLWRKVVYFRLFDTMTDAAAHKQLLLELNKGLLEALICGQNPTKEDVLYKIIVKKTTKINSYEKQITRNQL